MEAETSWVLDSLVGFLQGPIWNIPINSFIEQRSIVFEPEYDEEKYKETKDEREAEYRKIFEEYGILVDRLLSAHMEDLSITLEQFEEACHNAKGSLGAKFQQTLFEQIWAANDYDIFRALMVKRNIELNLQAMNILTTSLSHLSSDDAAKTISFLIDDDSLLEQVMKLSLEEAREEQDALDETVKEDVLRIAIEEKDRLEAERAKEQIKLDRALKRVMNGNTAELAEDLDKPAEGQSGKNNEDDDDGVENNLDVKVKNQSVNRAGYKSLKTEDDEDERKQNELANEGEDEEIDDIKEALLKPKGPTINPEEIKARQEYLRRRRDKIIETKRKERQRQVEQLEETEIKEKRPKSAKAVKSVLREVEDDVTEEDKGLSFRRSLAAKLKAEVIEKKK
ncbi:cilia- and flagella-associated protein 36-like [Tetranychus urticae]|uniref:Cilia- and flagella-associated protein 36 n=1 Tax=Tetranychus urticae TaxID=32264 RepID=T1KT85_TETUR|nr:cilia- and flagella-associated protein 36-like [Tetranychus urticae]